MSTFKVPVVKISRVEAHPNADRLDLVFIEGWVCVSGKGNFKPGDLAVYLPIDSVLPQVLEDYLFPPESKIKLSKHRVKTARIRGQVSQGMLVNPFDLMHVAGVVEEGADWAELLGVTKYEPPRPATHGTEKQKHKKKKRKDNPHFNKFTDLEHLKWYPTVFQEGEMVTVTEKIHGTNFRCGWVPFVARGWWDKLKGWLGLNPESGSSCTEVVTWISHTSATRATTTLRTALPLTST